MPITIEEFRSLEKEKKLLKKYFESRGKKITVKYEWRSEITGTYSPEIDIAVEPYAIHSGEKLYEDYDELVLISDELIDSFIQIFKKNYLKYKWLKLRSYPESYKQFLTESASNPNSRCFIAIEIESEKTSTKHKLGSMINACALGRIGILIARTDKVLETFFRLLAYLHFLEEVRKPSFNTNNIIIVTMEQFIQILTSVVS